jgi:ATP-dependent protease ClpP protease subunit
MDLKHVKNIQSNTASMFLFSEIGGWGIDGQEFANELQWLGKNGVDDVTIHINSGGGSVIDGLSILRSIQMFDGTIKTQIEGIAASIAGIIALGGQTRTMVDFGRIMIHDPSFANGDDMDDKQTNALNSIREMLIDIFDKNTNIDRDEIDTIMKTETWFDSITALSRGMIDEIVSTDRKAENVFEGQTNIADMVNRANSIHQQHSQTSIKNTMESVKNHLKLDKNSNETAVVDAITAIENRVQTAETKVTDLTNTIETKNTEIATATETITNKQTEIDGLVKVVATNAVDQAINIGKFSKEKRDELIDQAVEMGVEKFNNMITAIKSVPAKITDHLKGGDTDPTDGKTFRELEKSNPRALNALKTDNPTKYAELFKNEYGVEYAPK